MTTETSIADAVVRAAGLCKAPSTTKHILIAGGTHLIPLSHLFPDYAVEATVVIPSDTPTLDRDMELERAFEFESTYADICKGVSIVRDLSVIEDESVDCLIVCSMSPIVRDTLLKDAWKALKETGRIIIFTSSEIPSTHLASFGIVSPVFYATEGFYTGSISKSSALYAQN